MAANNKIDFLLGLNDKDARKVLEELYKRANGLFSKKGVELKLDNKGFNRSLDQSTDRILAFGASLAVISTVSSAFKRLASDSVSVETAFSKIQSILSLTKRDFDALTDSAFQLANKTGTSFKDTAEVLGEFARQGLTVEKTLLATNAALNLARVSGGNLTKTVAELGAISASFVNEALEFQDIADVLSNLDASFSTSASGLAAGLSRVASTAENAGVSFQTLSALIAATKQVSGRSESVIGNGLKSIFSNLGTESVQKEIENVGIATRNLDGSFRDADDVIRDLAGAFDKLTDSQKNNLSLKIAGKYNRNTLEAAFSASNSGVLSRAENVAGDSIGSTERRLQTLNSTTEVALQRLQNGITELANTGLGQLSNNLAKSLIEGANTALEGIKEVFAKGNPLGEAITGGITSVIKGPGLLLAAGLVGKLVLKVSRDLFTATQNILKGKNAYEQQLIVLKQITTELQKQGKIQIGNTAGTGVKTGIFTREKLKNAALIGSFAAPAIGGAIGSQIGGSGGRIASSAGEGLGTALFGASLGPLGAAAGTLVGSFQFLSTVTEELYGNFEEINARVAENINQQKKITDAAEAYINAQSALKDATQNGDNKLIRKAQGDLRDAGLNLTGGGRRLLETSDLAEQLKINEELIASSKKIVAANESTALAQDLVSRRYKDFIDQVAGIFGNKKLTNGSDLSGIADSFVRGLPDLVSKSGDISKGFLSGGGLDSVSSAVQEIVNSSPEFAASFKQLSSEFENGREALSLEILQRALSAKSLKDLNTATEETSKSLITLQSTFQKSISRQFSDSANRQRSGINRQRDDLAVSEILGPQDNADVLKASLFRGLKEINLDASEARVSAEFDFKKSVSETLGKNVQGVQQAEQLNSFLEQLNNPNFDLSNFKSEFEKSFGDSAKNSLRELTPVLEAFGEKLEEIGINGQKSTNSLIKTNAALVKIQGRETAANRFGDLGEDIKPVLENLTKARSALARFSSSNKKTRKQGLSEAEADAIIQTQQFDKLTGRQSVTKDEVNAAFRTKLGNRSNQTSSSIVGGTLTDLQDEARSFGRTNGFARNSPDTDQKFRQKVEAALAKGDFIGASKLVDGSNLSSRNKEKISNLISSENVRSSDIGSSANALTDKAYGSPFQTLETNTGVTATATQETATVLKSYLEEVSSLSRAFIDRSSSDSRISANQANLGSAREGLQKKIGAADVISRQIEDTVTNKGLVDQFISQASTGAKFINGTQVLPSNLQNDKFRNLPFTERSNKIFTGKGALGESQFGVNPETEIGPIKRAFSDEFKTLAERITFLTQELGQNRANQIIAGINSFAGGKTNLSERDFSNPADLLNKKQGLSNDIDSQRKEVERLENEKQALEASKNFKDAAQVIQEAFQNAEGGFVSKITAAIGVDFTGADFVTNPKVQDNLKIAFKAAFMEYWKQATGKDAVLLPEANSNQK